LTNFQNKNAMIKIFFAIIFCVVFATGNTLFAQDKVINIVVLGSSTAEGYGPSIWANAWVNQYRKHVQLINSKSTVTNLAKGSFTTYHLMPSDYTAPANRPSPDKDRNITKALSLYPDVIIINLPSNDATNGYSVSEQINNYRQIVRAASNIYIPVYITTPQPRNLSQSRLQNLMDMRDSTFNIFGNRAIDFWTDIANEDGTVNPLFDMGDGIHVNDSAHTIFKDRVVNSNVLAHSRIQNNAPVANAGNDQAVNVGDLVTLDGSASFDPDNNAITYLWKAPEGIALSANNVAQPTFTAPQVDEVTPYEFSLKVNDGKLDSEPSTVIVTVKDFTSGINRPAVANGKKQVNGYPNPNKGDFGIELSNVEQQGTIIIVDMLGRLIHRSNYSDNNPISISIPYIERGVYMITVNDGLSIETQKMVIQY
jgi:lysophospholipase L1-like esterase